MVEYVRASSLSAVTKNVAYNAVMNHIVENGIEARPCLVEALPELRLAFVGCLVASFRKVEAKKWGFDKWLKFSNNLAKAGLVLNKDDLTAVCVAAASYPTVARQFARIYAANALGAALVKKPRDLLGSAALTYQMVEKLALVKDADYSLASVAAWRSSMDTIIATYDAKSLHKKRDIKMTILEMSANLPITSTKLHQDYVLSCGWKEKTLGFKDGIPVLPHERLMCYGRRFDGTTPHAVQCESTF